MSTKVRQFSFLGIFDTCDVMYYWFISLLPPTVLDSLNFTNMFWSADTYILCPFYTLILCLKPNFSCPCIFETWRCKVRQLTTFLSGNIPNVQFPKRQLPKLKVRPSEAVQAAIGGRALRIEQDKARQTFKVTHSGST